MTVPPIVELAEVDSTNAEARRRAEAGETGPLWLLGLKQTGGRGRRGRAWSTGPGDLAATYLTVTDRPPVEAAQVSFVAALAVCDLVRGHMPPDLVRVKWPNDVMFADAKVSGILVESGARDDGRLWLAVGIGVNLANAPRDAERPAAALSDLSAVPPTPRRALEELADRFEAWKRIWQDFGFPAIADAWTDRAYGLGLPCVARLAAEEVRGVAEGMEADGSLRMRLPDGSIRRITAGDVFFEAA